MESQGSQSGYPIVDAWLESQPEPHQMRDPEETDSALSDEQWSSDSEIDVLDVNDARQCHRQDDSSMSKESSEQNIHFGHFNQVRMPGNAWENLLFAASLFRLCESVLEADESFVSDTQSVVHNTESPVHDSDTDQPSLYNSSAVCENKDSSSGDSNQATTTNSNNNSLPGNAWGSLLLAASLFRACEFTIEAANARTPNSGRH